ncbi:MAG TPA: hypothetical protein VHW69_08470 [Rhizomicrobium sp.]|jgi:hypothetical protein|nr:hypothetical protein [Rhizomicrobium sp.]
MDRRYYLAKFAIMVVALALAVAGSGMGGSRIAHAVNTHPSRSAPAQVQQAAWHAANSAVRVIVCTAAHALHTVAEVER